MVLTEIGVVPGLLTLISEQSRIAEHSAAASRLTVLPVVRELTTDQSGVRTATNPVRANDETIANLAVAMGSSSARAQAAA